MSAEAIPIPLPRFRSALTSLPISALYAKSRELHNSVSHLLSSNQELTSFITESGPDADCQQAIVENEETIARMEERILAVEYEVVVERGLPWSEEEGGKELGKGTGDREQARRRNEPSSGNGENGGLEHRTGETEDTEEGVFL
jgi:hypothetical protein